MQTFTPRWNTTASTTSTKSLHPSIISHPQLSHLPQSPSRAAAVTRSTRAHIRAPQFFYFIHEPVFRVFIALSSFCHTPPASVPAFLTHSRVPMAETNVPAVAGVAPPPSLLDQKLKKASPGRLGMLLFGLILVGGIIFIANRLMGDLSGVHAHLRMALYSSGDRALNRPGIRIRERFPRHRQRCRHGNLHAFAGAARSRGLVWLLEPDRRAAFFWRGSIRGSFAVARRADSASRPRRRLRDGVRAVGIRHPVEPRHMVARPSRFEFAHADRLDHRRRHRQPTHRRERPAPAAWIGDRQETCSARC